MCIDSRVPDIAQRLASLPDIAFLDNSGHAITSDTDAPVIAVKRGHPGYWPIWHRSSADELNRSLGVTPAQREAMRAGSLVGWHVPAADPDAYYPDGTLRR